MVSSHAQIGAGFSYQYVDQHDSPSGFTVDCHKENIPGPQLSHWSDSGPVSSSCPGPSDTFGK